MDLLNQGISITYGYPAHPNRSPEWIKSAVADSLRYFDIEKADRLTIEIIVGSNVVPTPGLFQVTSV